MERTGLTFLEIAVQGVMVATIAVVTVLAISNFAA